MIALIPMIWRVVIIIGAVVGVIALYTYWHHKIYQQGYDVAIAEVAAENKDAINAANVLREKRHACINSGRSWNVVSGMCE